MAKTLSLPKAELPADIDSLAAVVLASLPSSKTARDDIRAGDHDVDLQVTLRIRGVLKVGPDTSATQINKLKPWNLAKLLANRVPSEVLMECINMALAAATSDEKTDPAVVAMEAEADDLKTRVEAVFEQAGMAVKAPRRGSVRLHGDIDVRVREG